MAQLFAVHPDNPQVRLLRQRPSDDHGAVVAVPTTPAMARLPSGRQGAVDAYAAFAVSTSATT